MRSTVSAPPVSEGIPPVDVLDSRLAVVLRSVRRRTAGTLSGQRAGLALPARGEYRVPAPGHALTDLLFRQRDWLSVWFGAV